MENKNIIINNSNSFNWQPETYYYVGEKRYTAEEFNNAVEMLKNPQLNENQQVMLEWWVKKLNDEGEDADPLGVICAMQSYGLREEKIYDAAVNLTPAEQFQVLAAFAEWGMEQEEE